MEARRIPSENFVFLHPQKASGASSNSRQSNHESPLTILIVEEEEILYKNFKKANCPEFNFISTTYRESTRAALQFLPRLIFINLSLARALQVCRNFKTNTNINDIPVILIASIDQDGSRVQAYEAGIDDYIAGPANFNEVFVRAWNLIRSRQMLREKFLYFFSSNQSVTSADDMFLQRAMKIMEKCMGESSFGVDSFAREIGVSATQLYRKLTSLTGHTPNDFIRCVRLQRAAELLNQRTGNVAEIAYQVGFANLSYFAKCFKIKFGITPSEFLNSESRRVA